MNVRGKNCITLLVLPSKPSGMFYLRICPLKWLQDLLRSTGCPSSRSGIC